MRRSVFCVKRGVPGNWAQGTFCDSVHSTISASINPKDYSGHDVNGVLYLAKASIDAGGGVCDVA